MTLDNNATNDATAETAISAAMLKAKAPKAPKADKIPSVAVKPKLQAVAEVTADHVVAGRKLDGLLGKLDAIREEIHATALALKLDLCPKGITKGDNGRYLPLIADFLDQVFANDPRKPNAIRTAKARLISLIATTTKDQIGKDRIEAPRPRAPQQTEGNADNADNADNGDNAESGGIVNSKSAEQRAALARMVNEARNTLHMLETRSISKLTGKDRIEAGRYAAELREGIIAIGDYIATM